MTQSIQIERRLQGVPLSPGVTVARVCMLNEHRHKELPLYTVIGHAVSSEIARVESAIRLASEQLDIIHRRVIEKIGLSEAGIFVAQRAIMEDPQLLARIREVVETRKVNAESAVITVLDSYEARLAEVDNEYIRERATDFGEIRRRLLDILGEMKQSFLCTESHCLRGRGRIIVAERLTPSMTVELDAAHTMGFVTEKGGRSAHAAILARALGIPAVSGLPGLRENIACGDEILINGDTGEVVLWPTEATIRDVQAAQPQGLRRLSAIAPVPGLKVMANISLAGDVAGAAEMKAEGVGLYRTELELVAAGRFLTEDELFEKFSAVLAGMNGAPVVYRLPDIGSDKPLPFLSMPKEDNPALGWRGARLLLDQPDLLKAHARALARVSRIGAVSVLYPMIVDRDQFLRLKALFMSFISNVAGGDIRHGVMFEVPSACLQAEAILTVADFGSIGTNDLIQYLYAVDRNNASVAADFDASHPVLWDVMSAVVRAGARAGKPVTLCGEMGADPAFVSRLMDIGMQTVSVSARAIPAVRIAAAKRLEGAG